MGGVTSGWCDCRILLLRVNSMCLTLDGGGRGGVFGKAVVGVWIPMAGLTAVAGGGFIVDWRLAVIKVWCTVARTTACLMTWARGGLWLRQEC